MKKVNGFVKAACVAACAMLFAVGAFAADRTWTGLGIDNAWTTAENWSDDAVPLTGDNARFYQAAAVTVPSTITIRAIFAEAPVTVTVASGAVLNFSNNGAEIIVSSADVTIDGAGEMTVTRNGSSDVDFADIRPAVGTTLTIAIPITGVPDSGVELNAGGTLVLDTASSTFTGYSRISTAGGVILFTHPGALGLRAMRIEQNSPSKFAYIGSGPATMTIPMVVTAGTPVFENTGSGAFTFAGSISAVSGGAKTLTLAAPGGQPIVVSGDILNGDGGIGIVFDSTGPLTLSGNNNFSGAVAVNGGTLVLGSQTAIGSASQITMADSTTLSINPSAAPGFVTALPAVTVSGGLTLTVGTGTEVTLGGLSAASVAVTAPGIGAPGNRIFITGFPTGFLGAHITLNGGPAQYDDVNGLTPFGLNQQGIAVKGSTLPDGPTVEALINLTAVSQSPIQFTDPTTLFSLTMAYALDDAVVDTAGKALFANKVAISAGAGNLTVGVASQDGTLLPPLQMLPPPLIPDSTAISNLTPVIWYDPSDAALTEVYAGTVTRLTNKGAFGATHDAVVMRGGHTPPLYVTGAGSDAALPMLKIDANNHSLDSINLTGISGNAERTLIAVMSHAVTQNSIAMGVNTARMDFSIRMGITSGTLIRFNTYSGDRDVASPPAGTPAVLSFWSNADDGSGAQQDRLGAAVDGVPANTWMPQGNNALITENTMLHLGYCATDNSGRGQIGEVLLFDYTLSAQERKTVEDYLKAKWLQPKPVGDADQSGTLVLRNDSDAQLTVNATIAEPAGGAVSLIKAGAGDVTLAGGIAVSDRTLIDSGTLFVKTPGNPGDILGGPVSGAGKLTKDGPGILTLPYSAANLYTGGTDILGGTLLIGNSRSPGTGDIAITDGGALDVGAGITANSIALTNRVTVSGAGVGGTGAIVNNGFVQQQNTFQNTTVTLLDDTTFGGSMRWDFRGARAVLDLNGHVLTKVGTNEIYFADGASVSNAPAGVAFRIQEGYLGLHTPSTILDPDGDARHIAIDGGAGLLSYGQIAPVNWTLDLADGAEIRTTGTDEYTNKNLFATDVFLDSGVSLHLTSSGNFTKTFTGELTGPGGITVRDGGGRAMSLLTHPANTFTGPVAISNAILGLRYPDSLPGGLAAIPSIRLADLGGVRAYLGADGWTLGEVLTLMGSGLFNATAQNNQRLQIDVAPGEAYTIATPVTPAFLADIDKYGDGTLAFDADIDMAVGNFRTHGGTLLLTNDVTVNLHAQNIYLGDGAIVDGTSGLCETLLNGNSAILSDDTGYGLNSTTIGIAYHNGRSVLDIQDDVRVTGKFVVGGWDGGDTAAHGAIYQSGNAQWLSTGGAYNDSILGRYGSGYWQIDSGELTMKGYAILGWAESGNSVGILRQTGGAVAFNGSRESVPSANGLPGDSYGGWIDLSRGGRADLHLAGGTFTHYGQLKLAADGTGNNGNNNGGHAVMTVTGDAEAWIDRQIEMGYRNGSSTSILNINDGATLTATYIRSRKRDGNTTVTVNFDGGTLRTYNSATPSHNSARLIHRENSALTANLRIYHGGGTLDIGDGVTQIIDVPVEGALGMGVAAIAIGNGGTGYIAPPHVLINGGGGSGATAIAHIDRLSGELTGIEITCPGTGYITAPGVTLTGGGGSGVALGAVTLAQNDDGGIIKAGPGTLILSAAGTYGGPTRVDSGILRLEHPAAISPRSDVIIGDGTLDLGGNTVTVRSVTLAGSGGIVNGKVLTPAAAKTGSGTAFWDAEIGFVSKPPVPGLWEGGRKGNNINDYWLPEYPNPMTSVQLTTRAGNVINGNNTTGDATRNFFWANNFNMWIYTGYIWNRTEENQTWTWRGTFDDNVSLMIDGELLINQLGNTVGTTNYTLTPGPHPIEIRFGDGTGSVGPYSGQPSGLIYDPQGRGTGNVGDYRVLADPGDGSLLTISITGADGDTLIRVEEGTLLLPPDASGRNNYPGLWEGGPLAGAFNLTDPNPGTGIELTTTAANDFVLQDGTINGRHWPNNSTYIYTGYIWNNADTNETWTFAKSFDDSVRILINGDEVLNNTAHNQIVTANAVLNPGPNAIELRFGQGSGEVGAKIQGWWESATMPLGIDFLGRDEGVFANYAPIADPGDGSFLTYAVLSFNPDALNGATINVSDGATLDLGGIPRDGLTVTGNGAVTNGSAASGTSEGRSGVTL
ncbi:MAG: autotransporter-associated beta strand repeat-containing protein [Kiritimatiellaeota bacterium]|nr:autotransporter-associated beta strand repeat-containing protein [Kiritimatiellota bacterium]